MAARGRKKKTAPTKLIASPDEVRHHYDILQHGNRDMATSRGEMADKWKDAKAAGIHKKAMADCMKIKNMEETKRDDYLRAMEQYTADLDIRRSPDLLDDGGESPSNVVDFTGNDVAAE